MSKVILQKNLLGIEDLEIGIEPVTQIRNGKEVEVEPIDTLYDAGLLVNLDRYNLPVVRYLWFKGYYEEGDKGQGIYELSSFAPDEVEDDTGLFIVANDLVYLRQGSSIEQNSNTYYWVMFEWYGCKANDPTYNCAPRLISILNNNKIICLECNAGAHYYFKVFKDEVFTRTKSLEFRGNNCSVHFNIFAGSFNIKIENFLNYVIFRDLNYGNLIPEYNFDANKVKYFDIYQNSDILAPALQGVLYKKDVAMIDGNWNVSTLPVINKNNMTETALVNKAYVDKIYKIPDTAVRFIGNNRNISVFKQADIILERKKDTTLDDLDGNDIITKEEFEQWLLDNWEALKPEVDVTKSHTPPTGFMYLQYKCKYKKFGDYTVYIVNADTMYIIIDDIQYTCMLVETNGKYTCSYTKYNIDKEANDTIIYFSNLPLDEEKEEFIEMEEPMNLYLNTYWRLDRETDLAKYWIKL